MNKSLKLWLQGFILSLIICHCTQKLTFNFTTKFLPAPLMPEANTL